MHASTRTPRIVISGDEFDLVTRWRHVLCWPPGKKRRIKRKIHKRERYEAKQATRWEGATP